MAPENRPRAAHYGLYFHPYSICSLMVLYTLALRGEAKDPESEMTVETQEVDIFHEKQLDEHFLCEINAEGQVPVLVNPTLLEAPIPDSLKMTFYMASKYPDLIPSAHEAQIRQLLLDLHALNYFSLSFPGREHVAQGFREAILRRLAKPDISDRYRKALEYKLTVVQRDKVGGLVPSETTKMEGRARELLASLDELVPDPPRRWIFGEKPTALDAHLVVFIARMTDVGRVSLITDKLREYGEWAMRGSEWTTMMNGKKTMVPAT